MGRAIRDEWGRVSHALTVNSYVFTDFRSAREFSVMSVLAAINRELEPADQLTVKQVSNALYKLSRGDARIVRTAAGRYQWARIAEAVA